ncbi:transposase [Serratia fonticola]|uniref:transposase n=1 Tax=Serratia fonticola TaxID=47917 RepID=UPI0036F31A05
MSTKELRSRQHYSSELKLKLVKMALDASENGSSVAALAREYGINDNLLFKWVRLWQSEGQVSRPRRKYRKNASPTLLPCTDRGHHEHLFGDMVNTYNIGMSTSEWSCLCRGMRDLPCHYVPSLCFSPRKKALISVRYAASSA